MLLRKNSFGKAKKLRKTDEFSSVFRFKRVRRGINLDIYFRDNEIGQPRLGLVVPKKALPRAVDRNRLRRILRESFRLSQEHLGAVDIVIRVKVSGKEAAYLMQWDAFLRKRMASLGEASGQLMNG